MLEVLIDRLIGLNINIGLAENDNLRIHTDIVNIPRDLLQEIWLNKEDLVRYLKANEQRESFERIPDAKPAECYPLSSSQKRLWVISRLEEANIAYNMTGVYVLTGELDREALELSVATLSGHHEILRTVFRENQQGEPQQFIRSPREFGSVIQAEDLRSDSNPEKRLREIIEQEIRTAFDLSNGPSGA